MTKSNQDLYRFLVSLSSNAISLVQNTIFSVLVVKKITAWFIVKNTNVVVRTVMVNRCDMITTILAIELNTFVKGVVIVSTMIAWYAVTVQLSR